MIGVLGGTFDPIHLGHLCIAQEVQQKLALREVRFIPCRIPAHRGTPVVGQVQRKHMVELAIEGNSHFVLDEQELRREGPSYMVDTMQALRAELGEEPIALIVGSDAFMDFDRWHHWQALLELCHLVVTYRPGWELNKQRLSPALLEMLQLRQTENEEQLMGSQAGRVWFCPVTQLDISSSAIRRTLAQGGAPRYLVSEGVWDVIEKNRLYRN